MRGPMLIWSLLFNHYMRRKKHINRFKYYFGFIVITISFFFVLPNVAVGWFIFKLRLT